jgi:hypothetical protein
MTPDERRLNRLRRLERVRAIAKRQLAADSALAESALAQLNALTERTLSLAGEYAARNDAFDGYDLRQTGRFAAGLCQIAHSAGLDASTAQERADIKLAELAAAERRRAAVEQRLETEQRQLAKKGEIRVIGARRKIGTELE